LRRASRIEKTDPAAMTAPTHAPRVGASVYRRPRVAPNRMMPKVADDKQSAKIVAKKTSIASGTPLIKCGFPGRELPARTEMASPIQNRGPTSRRRDIRRSTTVVSAVMTK